MNKSPTCRDCGHVKKSHEANIMGECLPAHGLYVCECSHTIKDHDYSDEEPCRYDWQYSGSGGTIASGCKCEKFRPAAQEKK